MKKSLSHLPPEKREDLRRIVSYVLAELPDCEMIMLYGSYARGNYVEYDEQVEYGIRTTFMSDFDLLVVTREGGDQAVIDRKLDQVEKRYSKYRASSTPIQFIHEQIKRLNRELSDGHYFYTELKREAILLYDRGNCTLERRRKRNVFLN